MDPEYNILEAGEIYSPPPLLRQLNPCGHVIWYQKANKLTPFSLFFYLSLLLQNPKPYIQIQLIFLE